MLVCTFRILNPKINNLTSISINKFKIKIFIFNKYFYTTFLKCILSEKTQNFIERKKSWTGIVKSCFVRNLSQFSKNSMKPMWSNLISIYKSASVFQNLLQWLLSLRRLKIYFASCSSFLWEKMVRHANSHHLYCVFLCLCEWRHQITRYKSKI